MFNVVEILLYTLKRGTGAEFLHIMGDISVPLHACNNIDVVWHGQSLHCSDGYFLIRAFSDMPTMQASLDVFYSSEAWQSGPRTEILERIDSSLKVVIPMTNEAIEAIRTNGYSV